MVTAPARDERLAVAIAAQHGLRARTASPIVGAGVVNHVFVVRSGVRSWVVRFAIDPARVDMTGAEAWALRQAAAHGIPSPQVIGSGWLDGVPYLVQTFVPGVSATEGRQVELWRTLGRYARIVQTIPLSPDAPDALFSRFGRNLPAAWDAHVRYNLGELAPTDPLIDLGVYLRSRQGEIARRIQDLRSGGLTFGLNHGDLCLENLLLPEGGGPPVLVDWGSASAGPSPIADLVILLAKHRAGDLDDAELAAFADGFGVPLRELMYGIDDITLLAALDLVRWALANRPDLVHGIVTSSTREVTRLLGRGS